MSLYTADLGSASLTDVGYVWKDSAGADIGARTTTGVSELESGIYGADITPAAGAQGIFWDSASQDTDAFALGDVRPENFEVLGIETDGDLSVVNTLTGHTAQTGDSYARLGAPAGASVSADIATVDTVADGIQTDLSNATDGLGALKALIDALPASSAIADAVWDEAQSGHVTAGTFGLFLDAVVSGATAPTAAAVADAVLDEALSGHTTAGTLGKAVADIEADTNELQSDNVPGLIAAQNNFNPATDAVANVTLVATTTTNTDMRGTDSAALASVATEARLAELDAANLPADVDTLLGRISSTLFSGITSLAEWLGLMAGKQAADATALTEIKATGAGSGTYSETTDSLEGAVDGSSAPSAATVAAEVDTVLTAAHGSGSWATGGSGSGAYGITVTVTDGTNPLENASVRLIEGITAYTATTDASGNASFSLDAATYSVRVTKANHSFSPTTRTVTAEETGTLTDDLEMTAVTVAAPSDPNMCRCSARFLDINGAAVVGATITFQLMGKVAGTPAKATTFIKIDEYTATTDANGDLTDGTNAYLDLQRTDAMTATDREYQITSSSFGIKSDRFTLEAATFDLLTLDIF